MPEKPRARRTADLPPDECANCGAPIARGAHACPECGADERTGWRETSVYDDLDLPAEAWEEDRQASAARDRRRAVNGIAWYWWCAGVVLTVFLGLGALALLD